ncbi:FAD-dependent oxidoreductase [Methylobacterium sp. W2]|uniref:FAD-dependent oxidoreductase n=1 Tax=Methylobacterium sp. W2 TaxID=2598107 RepID=UPI001D0CB9D2|nr:FAD-dependent oxidoreductase [Methylobacterium sp. W2]MCC0809040.1 FAD-dependent oxidoreductase [Methylobacterium sp. W2]
MANTNPYVVWAATPAGILAAVDAARQGAKVKLLEPSNNIGGVMTRGALCQTDNEAEPAINPGSDNSRWGLSKEVTEYWQAQVPGGTPKIKPTFKVAQDKFDSMIANEPNITLVTGVDIQTPIRDGVTGRCTGFNTTIGVIAGDNWNDASYEGDMAYKLGCFTSMGRENSLAVNEITAGMRPPTKDLKPLAGQGPIGIDPLTGQRRKGIDPRPNQLPGMADRRLMAFMTRTFMTRDPDGIKFATLNVNPDPELYRADLEVLVANKETEMPASPGEPLLPAAKIRPTDDHAISYVDVNNGGLGPAGLNLINGWNDWPNATWAQRFAMRDAYLIYKAGFLKTICTNTEWASRLPELVADTKSWGLVPGLFTNSIIPGMSEAIYVRRMRRLVGQAELVMQSWVGPEKNNVPEPVTMFGYPHIDAHWYQRYIGNAGRVLLEGGGGLNGGYGEAVSTLLPFGALKARLTDCRNLMVSCVASGTMMGSINDRIELSWMRFGNVSGCAGGLAQLAGIDTGALPYAMLRPALVARGSRLVH